MCVFEKGADTSEAHETLETGECHIVFNSLSRTALIAKMILITSGNDE